MYPLKIYLQLNKVNLLFLQTIRIKYGNVFKKSNGGSQRGNLFETAFAKDDLNAIGLQILG